MGSVLLFSGLKVKVQLKSTLQIFTSTEIETILQNIHQKTLQQ